MLMLGYGVLALVAWVAIGGLVGYAICRVAGKC